MARAPLARTAALLALAACATPALAQPAHPRLDPHAARAAESGQGGFAGGTFAPSRREGGQDVIDVFIDANVATIPALVALGVEVRTVLPSGLMTATVPIARLNAVGGLAGVRRVEAARSVKKLMDVAVGPIGLNVPASVGSEGGQGVLVGVIDSGIDYRHPDFAGRVQAIWDQTLDPSDVSQAAPNPADYAYGTEWSKAQIDAQTCASTDTDGHGTHVTGTIAGAGVAHDPSLSERRCAGVAPKAEILFVKFDFDNVKGRNTDAAIVDGVAWIFQQAALRGKPCVINMSLGSDYGPKDGTLAEERGIDELTGPGRIVCVAAGNAGRSYASAHRDLWGPPIHGAIGSDGADDIALTIPAYTPTADPNNDYAFFDIWYPAARTCRVFVTTPGNRTYPSSTGGPNRRLWVTGGLAGGYNTTEGSIYVANKRGSDNGWATNSPDNNIYIEISDSGGSTPAVGLWRIDIVPDDGGPQITLQAWNGNASSLNLSEFRYDGQLSNNAMSIGAPATAKTVIAVGAYQTKHSWQARQYSADGSSYQIVTQSYGLAPLNYYDPFTVEDLAYFSSRGPSRDGRLEPFISAPGVGIVAPLSAQVTDTYFQRGNRISPSGRYATLQGTSMATPCATGAVALLLEKARAVGGANDPAAIKGYLRDGARRDMYTGAAANDDWGHGKADVTRSLPLIAPAPNVPPVANAGPDQVRVDQDQSGAEQVTLDGSASTDSDGQIVAWTWQENGATVASGATVTVTASVGVHVYTLIVTDNRGGTASDSVQVEVSAGGTADKVVVTRASYNSRKKQLTVEATSSAQPAANLTVTWPGNATPVTMGYNAGKLKYTATATVTTKPASVTVTSSLGGSATAPVP